MAIMVEPIDIFSRRENDRDANVDVFVPKSTVELVSILTEEMSDDTGGVLTEAFNHYIAYREYLDLEIYLHGNKLDGSPINFDLHSLPETSTELYWRANLGMPQDSLDRLREFQTNDISFSELVRRSVRLQALLVFEQNSGSRLYLANSIGEHISDIDIFIPTRPPYNAGTEAQRRWNSGRALRNWVQSLTP